MSIDINELTVGDIKMISEMFNNMSGQPSSGIAQGMIGKYVLVRSRNEGINSGFVEKADETGIVLTESRRIWYHRPKNKAMCWYEGVSISGLSSDSKVSAIVPKKIIVEDYSITECLDVAIKSLQGHKTHEQD